MLKKFTYNGKVTIVIKKYKIEETFVTSALKLMIME
jgi:hypothetical protein